MKTIAIDLSPAEVTPAGIGQYTINLTKKLIELDTKNNYLIYTTQPFNRLKFDEKRVSNVVVPFPPRYRARGIRWMMDVNKDMRKRNVDTLISYSNHFFSLIYPNTIQFIHDLAPIKYPQYFPVKARMLYPFTTRMALQKSRSVITISNTVRKEILAFSKVPAEKVEVVYPAKNEMAQITNDNYAESGIPDLPKLYLLTVSTLEPRKNIEGALKAFAKLKLAQKLEKGLKFVIVGKKGWYYERIFKLVEALGLKDDVIFTGYVADEHMPEIYKQAKGFVYLSHYEGFGMPPLEALAYNKPTLLSDIPVLRECFGPWAKFAAPEDIDTIAEKMQEILKGKQPKVSGAVIEKYSWGQSAKKLLAIIKKVTDNK